MQQQQQQPVGGFQQQQQQQQQQPFGAQPLTATPIIDERYVATTEQVFLLKQKVVSMSGTSCSAVVKHGRLCHKLGSRMPQAGCRTPELHCT